MLNELSKKNIAVFGLGVSGKSALSFCKKIGAKTIVVGDIASETIDGVGHFNQNENHIADLLSSQDMIILSPGIPREHPILEKAFENQIEIINEVDLAARYFPGKIIAVTGTNGKTTTVSLLKQSLEQLGKKVFLGGNYGVPFLDWLCGYIDHKDELEFAVIELSSFQLESLKEFKADIGMILNISPSHMERYDSFESYQKAKLNLKNHSKIFFDHHAIETTESRDNFLNSFFDLKQYSLSGDYNKDNLWYVLKTLESLNINFSSLQIDKLKAEPFRFEKLAPLIFNDGKSTNWDATCKAVEAAYNLGDIQLILGGKMRSDGDLPDEKTVSFLKKTVSDFFLFGDAGPKLSKILGGKVFNDLTQLVEQLDYKKVILFSPAYPSFDLYKNYIERGKHFTSLVEQKLNEL